MVLLAVVSVSTAACAACFVCFKCWSVPLHVARTFAPALRVPYCPRHCCICVSVNISFCMPLNLNFPVHLHFDFLRSMPAFPCKLIPYSRLRALHSSWLGFSCACSSSGNSSVHAQTYIFSFRQPLFCCSCGQPSCFLALSLQFSWLGFPAGRPATIMVEGFPLIL